MKAAALALAVLMSTLSGCQTDLGYLVKQGGWLYHYSRGTRNIDSLLESPSTPEDTRDFLLRVKDIRRFAVERVGLRDNGNYTRYRSIDRDHLVDVVQACDAVSFTPYQWSYPLLGKLPYKGFYERADADAEASRLRKAGFDVIVRKVDAFSTLGFLHDPLYSFMKTYPPFELASTIIHEQTHATLFVRGQPDFNEELATFVGETGAFQWLEETYGTGSKEYRDAVDGKADFDLFMTELKGLSAELKKVYDGPLSREEKLADKARIIAAFKAAFRQGSGRFRTPEYRAARDLPLNNAFLSLYDLYTNDIPLLRSYEQKMCGGSLKSFMQAAERLSKKGDIKEQMRAALAAGDSH